MKVDIDGKLMVKSVSKITFKNIEKENDEKPSRIKMRYSMSSLLKKILSAFMIWGEGKVDVLVRVYLEV